MFRGLAGPGDGLHWSHAHQQQWRKLSRRCKKLRIQATRALHGTSGRWRVAAWGSGGAMTVMAATAAANPGGPEDDPAKGVPKVREVREKSIMDFGHPRRRATDVLLVFNCLCFALQWLSQDKLTYLGAKVNAFIAAGQWWRLITPVFLHSSLFHLAVNSHALNSIGPHVEIVGGSARLVAVYMVSAFTGTLASYTLTPAPSIGASGAIFGLGAALGLFYWRHKEVLRQHSDNMLQSLGLTVAINLVYSLCVKNIDNWGHLGGLLGGAATAWLLGPRMVRGETGRFVDRPLIPVFAYQDGMAFGGLGNGSRSSSTASLDGKGGGQAPEGRHAKGHKL